jgi:hypothetical protein
MRAFVEGSPSSEDTSGPDYTRLCSDNLRDLVAERDAHLIAC